MPALLGLAGMVLALVLVRLLVAPLSLPLTAQAERVLQSATGLPISVGSVAAKLGADGLTVLTREVNLEASAFATKVAAIELTVGVGGRTLAILGPRFRWHPTGTETGTVPMPEEAIESLDSALSTFATRAGASLATITVREGRIEMVGASGSTRGGATWTDVDGEIAFPGGGDVIIEAAATASAGRVVAAVHRTGAPGAYRLTARVEGIGPHDFGAIGPIRSGFRTAALLDARLEAAGDLRTANLSVNVGPGRLAFGNDPERSADGAAIELVLSAADDRIEVRTANLSAGLTEVNATGFIRPAPQEPWAFALEADEAIFGPQKRDDRPVVLQALSVAGALDFGKRLLSVTALDVVAPFGGADAVLALDFGPDGPRLSGAAEIGAAPVEDLLAVWPRVMAHGPRQALASTVVGGMVRGGSLNFALTQQELDGDPKTSGMIEGGLAVDVGFAGATLRPPELPLAILNARGSVRVRDKRFAARIEGGVVKAGEAGSLTVDEAVLTIPELGANPASVELVAQVRGPLSAVVALAHRFGITEVKGTPIAPDDVAGEVEATLTMRSPLKNNVPLSERSWTVDARLTGASSKVPVNGRTFTDADLELMVNRRRLAARGRAKIDGLAIDVNYTELFAGASSGAARFVLTDKDRRERGFDTGDRLTGPIVVTLEAEDGSRRTFSADLTQAAVDLPGFDKAPGTRLVAEGTMEEHDDTIIVSSARLEGEEVDVEGEIALGEDGLRSAVLSPLALSGGDEAHVVVEAGDDGTYRVTVNAPRFDLSGIIADLKEAPGGAPDDGSTEDAAPRKIVVEARGDRLRIAEEAVAADVTLDATHVDGRLARLALAGRLDGRAAGSFGVKLQPTGEAERTLRADVAELGRLLTAFGVYERMHGGRTTLTATLADDGAMAGRLRTTDFVLTNERSLEEVLAATRRARPNASLDRGTRPLNYRATDAEVPGLAFDALVIDFHKRGSTIHITDAVLRGDLLGGTASGTIDLDAGELLLNGTFIPAYGVNNLFGRVPIVGGILGAGDKGGLIGMTFRLSGPLEAPQLTVNPISAMAPGIFRRIFEFR